ncbi:MAG: hypothetical protein KA198_07205, partial [Chitinophagaceae bacterium]|nr:hypothetical protein [Chitinophagaceae bacterium]
MNLKKMIGVSALALTMISNHTAMAAPGKAKTAPKKFNVMAEGFADLQVLRYQIPGFENLTLKEKQLAYYLYEATLSGRDMIYDQKSKYGILLRKTIENIYTTYKGDKTSADWKKFQDYCGRFWFSNGNHHHYGNEKFVPECSTTYFKTLVMNSNANTFPKENNESVAAFWSRVEPLFYDMSIEPKCVDLRSGIDNITSSSNNFYEGVTMQEVESFYDKMPTTGNAPSWGLNSKVVKENGVIKEKVWKSGGMYGTAIDKIIYWLEKAIPVAENAKQQKTLELLVKFLRSGDLKDFDAYSIAWVNDTESKIDGINGFIEVYLDAIGKKGSYESYVSIKDMEASKRLEAIAKEAQWFED